MKIIRELQASYKNTSLQGKLYYMVIYIGTCLAIISTIINVTLLLDKRTMLVTGITTIFLLLNISYAYKKNTYEWPARIALLYMLVFVYPTLWITNSGLSGPTPYFFIFNTLLVTVILDRRYAILYILLTFLIVAILISIEITYPSMITPYYNELTRKIDVRLSMFFIGLSVITIVSRLMAEYHKKIDELEVAQRQLHQLSVTDELTGIYNRRHILQQIQLRNNDDNPFPFTIMMFDIDDFKNVNDTYGHSVGDEVICGISRLLESKVRPSDVVGRIGGEEFLVCLINTQSAEALSRAEMIRTAVADAQWSKDQLKVTISGGVYTRLPSDSVDELLEKVDSGLYAAKSNGKNCIVTWQDTSFA